MYVCNIYILRGNRNQSTKYKLDILFSKAIFWGLLVISCTESIRISSRILRTEVYSLSWKCLHINNFIGRTFKLIVKRVYHLQLHVLSAMESKQRRTLYLINLEITKKFYKNFKIFFWTNQNLIARDCKSVQM
jgi:hypothetical protein